MLQIKPSLKAQVSFKSCIPITMVHEDAFILIFAPYRLMKPYPDLTLNHLTVPVTLVAEKLSVNINIIIKIHFPLRHTHRQVH